MAEYIDRKAAKDMIKKEWDGCGGQYEAWQIILDTCAAIDELPPAEVRPVVRGRWLLDSDPGEPWKYKCDQCGEVTNNTCMGKPRYNYCPMCGADMRDGDAE